METVTLYTYGHGSFAKALQFEVLVIILGIIVVARVFFPSTYAFVVILLMFALYIANQYITIRKQPVNDINELTMHKIRGIQDRVNYCIQKEIERVTNGYTSKNLSPALQRKLYKNNRMEYLFMNANMVHFVYSLDMIHIWNPREYLQFIKGLNTILRLKHEIEEYHKANDEYPANTATMFETALQLKTNTRNNLHNMIYSVPKSNVMYAYVVTVVDRYTILLNRNMDTMHQYYTSAIEEQGINTSTKFVAYNQTKPFDAHTNHSVIPSKTPSTLISFYQ